MCICIVLYTAYKNIKWIICKRKANNKKELLFLFCLLSLTVYCPVVFVTFVCSRCPLCCHCKSCDFDRILFWQLFVKIIHPETASSASAETHSHHHQQQFYTDCNLFALWKSLVKMCWSSGALFVFECMADWLPGSLPSAPNTDGLCKFKLKLNKYKSIFKMETHKKNWKEYF